MIPNQQQYKQNTPEVIGRIKVNQASDVNSPNIQVNLRRRGNSANPTNMHIMNNPAQKKKIGTPVASIITQVPKDQTSMNLVNMQKTQKIEKSTKSHSYSPNRLLNSMQLGLLPPKSSNKKTLVLDLDETLVHSGFSPFSCPSDVIIKIELDNEIHDIHVLVRPGVKEFLEKMASRYEIVIFTASLSKYADPLLDIIDKKGYCPFRLFREHCTLINTTFVKDLKRLGRDLKDIIIVDNSPVSYALNPDNGLPITSWFDDKSDRELYNITPILEFLSYVPDVREYIGKMVVNNEISYNKAMNAINSYNTMVKKKNSHFSVDNKEVDKKPQQINIKIINNNITNYICNNNDENTNTTLNASNSNSVNSSQSKFSLIQKNQKSVNSFRNIAVSNTPSSNMNGNLKQYRHKKNDSYHHKNNFLNTGYVSTTKGNIANINTNNNQINITGIDFMKSSRKKNPIKYTSALISKQDDYMKPNTALRSTNSVNKLQKSANFLHSTASQELLSSLNRKGSKPRINSSTGSKTSTNSGHMKSLSYNFDVNGINTVRPKSSKKVIHYDNSSNNNDKKKKSYKDFRFELNEILQRRGVSKSSRANDLKGGFKYHSPINSIGCPNFTVKYTNKIIK